MLKSGAFALKSGTDYEGSRISEGKSRKFQPENRTFLSKSRTAPRDTRTPPNKEIPTKESENYHRFTTSSVLHLI